jgi:hypothetical protein
MSAAIALYACTTVLHPDTLDEQLTVLRTYAATHGWPVDDAPLYLDDALIEVDLNRPGLNRLLDAVRQGAVTTIVVTNTSTFTQFLGDLTKLEDELAACGATVIYAGMSAAALQVVRDAQTRWRDPEKAPLNHLKEVIAKYDQRRYQERVAAGLLDEEAFALEEAG